MVAATETEKNQAEKIAASLASLGNLSARKTLGENLPVNIYRIMRLFGVGQIVGSASNAVMINSGRTLGKTLGETFKSQSGSLESFIGNVTDFFKTNSVGLVSIRQDSNTYLVQVDECVTCSGVPDSGQFICGLEGGIVVGIFQAYFNKNFFIKEIKCWANGDDNCLFRIDEHY
jgi:predicted hydrocarbon binding protein